MKQTPTPTKRQKDRKTAIQALIDGPTQYSEADRTLLNRRPTSSLLKAVDRIGTRKPVPVR